jgi:formate dehydrogenase subunit delta
LVVDPENLVRMANRIGEFFDAHPNRDEASDGVATHIARFWEPRMRRQLLQLLDTASGDQFSPLVVDSLRQHRTRLTPAA